jgi:PAS domain S-box-containing protein
MDMKVGPALPPGTVTSTSGEVVSSAAGPLAIEIPLPLAEVDSKGNRLATNAAWDALLGHRVWNAFSELVDPDAWAEARKSMRLVLAGRDAEAHEVEVQLNSEDGNTRIIGVRFAVLNAQNKTLLLVGVDISDRKRAEHQLLEQNQILAHARGVLEEQKDQLDQHAKELEKAKHEAEAARAVAEAASRSKSEFLANMSHEIRTPMTAILGYADILLDPSIRPNQQLDCVQVIRRNGEHLLSIINDILDIAKIEAGKMTIEQIDCSIEEVLANVESLMRVRASEKRLEFGVTYLSPIPKTVQTDPTRLRQIVLNLTGNALKFTQKGGVKIQCDFVATPRATIRVSVVDTGIGLTESQLAALFLPFQQADESTTRKFGGTGLGLAISRRLSQMLGGDIVVTSTHGEGSCFAIEFFAGNGPFEFYQPTGVRVPAAVAPAVTATAGDQPLAGRVLLAEDGIDNQRLVKFQLSKLGIDVEIAENGLIALQKFDMAEREGRRYDLVLMDMQMPEMDGYAATKHLRARGYVGPIVALTAHAMAGDRDRCIDTGCSDYLTKPIDRRELQRVLKENLSGTSGSKPDEVIEQPIVMDHEMWNRRAVLLQQLMAERKFDDLRRELAAFKSLPDTGPDSLPRLAQSADASLRLRADLMTINVTVQQLVKGIKSATQSFSVVAD